MLFMQKAKRILALAGVILLVAMYGITLVLGLTASPATKGMLTASLMCSIIIPILLYAMMLVARVFSQKNADEPDKIAAKDQVMKKSKKK